jgi:hypothetical protein
MKFFACARIRRNRGSCPPSPTLTLYWYLRRPILQPSQRFSRMQAAPVVSVTGTGVIVSLPTFLAPLRRACNNAHLRYRGRGPRRSSRHPRVIPLR